MTRTPLWSAIAAALRTEIADGRYGPGDKLPTEAALAERFGVNRHTVRHALRALADEGAVRSRRGAGVFVTARPTEYPLGKRVRFHRNVRAGGQAPEKRILALEERGAAPGEATPLALAPGAPVVAYHGLSLADGAPIALFVSVFPALPGLADALREETGVTAALARCGIPDYTRASTRISARAADATQALHLHLPEGAALIYATGVNVGTDGAPVEFGRTWFAGDRVTLTLDES
ncbi:MAG: phosphonate metabolism transcriptional regulator PhnF [Shimia sp.]